MFPAMSKGHMCRVEDHLYWGQGSISEMKRSQEVRKWATWHTHREDWSWSLYLLITLRIRVFFPEGHWWIIDGILTERSNCIANAYSSFLSVDIVQLFTLVSRHILLSSRMKVFMKIKHFRVHFSSCTNTLKLGICEISEPSHRQMRLLSWSHFRGAEEELDEGRGRKEACVA